MFTFFIFIVDQRKLTGTVQNNAFSALLVATKHETHLKNQRLNTMTFLKQNMAPWCAWILTQSHGMKGD